MKNIFRSWWKWLRYEPTDPRFKAGSTINIAVIGGGTGLSNLLRGLKKYSDHISAIVTVADEGGSTGEIRKDFDMLAPGDIRKCIGALALNEELFSNILEHRFSDSKKIFGGHTLGNIWITALTDYYGSFEKAIEVTSQIFETAGCVLPATLSNINLVIRYKDGTVLTGEHFLDEELREVEKISLTKPTAAGYAKAILAINQADLIIIGPGSLYGSILPNLLIRDIREAILSNKKAIRVYVANCSTERTQTRNYNVEKHLRKIKSHVSGKKIFDYCIVNNRILRHSSDEAKLGEINNITTSRTEIDGVKVVLADVVSEQNPLYHDSNKLANVLIELYNNIKQSGKQNSK